MYYLGEKLIILMDINKYLKTGMEILNKIYYIPTYIIHPPFLFIIPVYSLPYLYGLSM